MMKVLYDHQIFGVQSYGGVSRYFYEISRRIAGAGNEVEIFAPLYVNEYFRATDPLRPRGIKVPFRHGAKRLVAAVNETATRLVMRARRDVDLFHVTYYCAADHSPPSAKRVLTVHDMIHEKFGETSGDREMPKLKADAVRRADHVICVSENTRRDLMKLLSVPEEKVSVVRHGFSLAPAGAAASRHRLLPGKPFLLYVGARAWYKNFERMLAAYAASPLLRNGFSLVCFGGGAPSPGEWELCRSLRLGEGEVRFLSGGDDLLADLYRAASALVFPSLYEGFGIPPLEAMSFGCPVVCSNGGSLPEVVGDAAELFDPTDVEQMRWAVERVVSEPELARLLVSRGSQRVKQFSWDRCAEETLEVYGKVVRG